MMKKTANLFLVIICLMILVLVGCSKNEEKKAHERTVKDGAPIRTIAIIE